MARTVRRAAFAPRLENLEGRTLLSAGGGGRLLIGVAAAAPSRPLALALRSLDAQIVESFPAGPKVVEVGTDVDLEAAAARLARTPGVRYAEPERTVSLDALRTNDPQFDALWGLSNPNDVDIDAPEAWQITPGGPGTIVAVIDTGIDLSHPDLAGRIWTNPREISNNRRDDDRNGFVDDVHGWNFAANTNDVRDGDGHGTHIAGVIAATANNSLGVVGAAPGTRVMPLKFIGADGNGKISDAVSAIYYAVNHGAKVINASWGGQEESAALRDAIAYADARGVVFVTAAGNVAQNNDRVVSYPASIRLPNVLSVAAVDSAGRLADFSNYGAGTVDVAAPGVGIRSTTRGGGYHTLSGTSVAVPHVAAAVALLAGRNPTLTAGQLANRIRTTAKPLPSLAGKTISGGIASAYRALTNTTSPRPLEPATVPVVLAREFRLVILGSDDYYASHGGTPEAYVDALYRSLLGRPVDPAGIALWAGMIHQGTPRAEIARIILNTEEAHRTTVARWFIDDLGRPAAALETIKADRMIIEWAGVLARGAPESTMRVHVLSSEEFYARQGGTPEGYVDALYRTVLGRPADPSGLAGWSSLLRQGRTRQDIALGILTSPEAGTTTLARWFIEDLFNPIPLATLKTHPTMLEWVPRLTF